MSKEALLEKSPVNIYDDDICDLIEQRDVAEKARDEGKIKIANNSLYNTYFMYHQDMVEFVREFEAECKLLGEDPEPELSGFRQHCDSLVEKMRKYLPK